MKQIDQDDGGLKRLLTISWFYDFFQERLLGGSKSREWLATNAWKARSGEVVVDIGCGSGTTLAHLPPDIEYLGIDVSDNYIRSARKKFPGRGTFFLGTVHDLIDQDGSHSASADLVLCNGLLHHLTDGEALEVLELAKRIMKPGGRLVCLEAVFLARQTGLSRWIVDRDRGRHVRLEQEWKDLIGQAFESYSTRILTGLLRIPYTHIVIECFNESSSSRNGNLKDSLSE
jgi:ubiquinone/menaquinone biosynthesis C-methylase UbiE